MTTTNDFFNRLEGVWENKIDGEWRDDFGWNFISQPRLGQPGPDDFEMRFDQMRETITFVKLGGQARNVGVSGEAGFWQAMKYEVAIETPAGKAIHHEMGHFLLNVLEGTEENLGGDTLEDLRGDVLRQATIPRANAMMTAGTLTPGAIPDADDIYDARPQANDPTQQDRIETAFAVRQAEVSDLDGPPLDGPLSWLFSMKWAISC